MMVKTIIGPRQSYFQAFVDNEPLVFADFLQTLNSKGELTYEFDCDFQNPNVSIVKAGESNAEPGTEPAGA